MGGCPGGAAVAEDAASPAWLALAPAVEAIARELRQRHVEQRQAETNEATTTKVAKWRAGKFCPLGGRHKVKVTPC